MNAEDYAWLNFYPEAGSLVWSKKSERWETVRLVQLSKSRFCVIIIKTNSSTSFPMFEAMSIIVVVITPLANLLDDYFFHYLLIHFLWLTVRLFYKISINLLTEKLLPTRTSLSSWVTYLHTLPSVFLFKNQWPMYQQKIHKKVSKSNVILQVE